MRRIFLIMLVFYCCGMGNTMLADVVFPARLEIVEVEPGVFRVLFQLPIVNGQYPKAEAVFPFICEPLGDEAMSYTNTSFTRSWMMRCESDKLYGQVVQIDGLLGTNVDVILQIDLLNSRSYSILLRPGKSAYTIPEPPGTLQLLGLAFQKGMKGPFRQRELWLLFILFAFAMPGRKLALRALACFFGAYVITSLLAHNLLLEFWPGWAAIGAMLVGLFLSLRILEGPLKKPFIKADIAFAAILLGSLFGAGHRSELAIEGLSLAEMRMGNVFQQAGVALALAIMFSLLRSFRQGIVQSFGFDLSKGYRRSIAYAGGILCGAFFFYWLSSTVLLTSQWPDWPISLTLGVFVVGIWLGQRKEHINLLLYAALLVSLSTGLVLGGIGLSIPFHSLIFTSSVFALGIALATGFLSNDLALGAIAAVCLLATGSETGDHIRESLSLPVAKITGALVLALAFGYFVREIFAAVWFRWPISVKVLGALAALSAILLRLSDYVQWWDHGLMGQIAMGRLLIPVLSLSLLFMAIVLWPKRRKAARQLQATLPGYSLHWILLAIAFFLLPFGNLKISSPFRQDVGLAEEQARRLLEQTLSQTYFAFNLSDDEALYDELAQCVSEDLIADIFLDSRRRLSEGVRDGAEVRVREVKVLEVGEPLDGNSYPCTWSVTARVKHLQHVHHRRNIYTGVIDLSAEEDSWKIDKVALHSEDRAIVPAPRG